MYLWDPFFVVVATGLWATLALSFQLIFYLVRVLIVLPLSKCGFFAVESISASVFATTTTTTTTTTVVIGQDEQSFGENYAPSNAFVIAHSAAASLIAAAVSLKAGVSR